MVNDYTTLYYKKQWRIHSSSQEIIPHSHYCNRTCPDWVYYTKFLKGTFFHNLIYVMQICIEKAKQISTI